VIVPVFALTFPDNVAAACKQAAQMPNIEAGQNALF
jgi:hypothetical protein